MLDLDHLETLTALSKLETEVAELRAYRAEVECSAPIVQGLLDSGEAAESRSAQLEERIRELEAEAKRNRSVVIGSQSVIKHADQCKQEMADALGLIQKLEIMLADLEELAKWRPIEYGLPEDRINVLVWDGQSVLKAFQRGGYWLGDGLFLSRKITHWLPLIAGPKEKS